MTDSFRLPIAGTLENHYARLPEDFYTKMPAEKVGDSPRLIHANASAAALLDLNPAIFDDPRFAEVMGGHRPLEGFSPLAMVYSGHQFGVWAGQLGDGRALLIGQVRNAKGELWDVQLKGAGKTPYSRFGDGRAVMRSTIREYLCSEAMAALGIATSRALAIVATGETVLRETREPGAVLTRLAQSHVRFGHFEHFFHRGEQEQVRALADHVIAEHFPDLAGDHAAWYGEVVRRTAVLVAQWQAVGFAHGVMNTDNMSILGLTLDYGPYGFMDAYDPQFICNHTDEQGRYSFINQPVVAHWNLRALALALSGLIPTDRLVEKLATFEQHFGGTYHALMRAKLGLTREVEGDNHLIGGLLALMAKTRADYTLSFRNMTGEDADWLALFGKDNAEAQAWLSRYRVRTQSEDLSGLDRVNPKFVLRNWVAESAIRAVEDHSDIATLERIFRLVQAPFEKHDGDEAFAAPPPPEMSHLEVSCSS
ncbi:MAG TPA: YdiU family protein [Rhizomicrobium sp.]|nr:YdiU family protein [Rhizomicrobium sp.]